MFFCHLYTYSLLLRQEYVKSNIFSLFFLKLSDYSFYHYTQIRHHYETILIGSLFHFVGETYLLFDTSWVRIRNKYCTSSYHNINQHKNPVHLNNSVFLLKFIMNCCHWCVLLRQPGVVSTLYYSSYFYALLQSSNYCFGT